MFRFTIRELMLLAVVAVLGTAWWLDHRELLMVRDDAKALAQYGDPHEGACGSVAGFWSDVANKYVEQRRDEGQLTPSDE